MIDHCWNVIGVRGDSTCAELSEHVHCRNCPVFSSAALGLLERAFSPADVAAWTDDVARVRPLAERDTHSVVVFRLASEWLALPTLLFAEIAGMRAIHRLPNRSGGNLLGLANIRGELLACVSLHRILGLTNEVEHVRSNRPSEKRLLVLEREHERVVCPVDEAFGIAHFNQRELAAVPTTLAGAVGTFTKAVLSWRDKTVGVLDEELLFYALDGSLTSTPI